MGLSNKNLGTSIKIKSTDYLHLFGFCAK